MRFKALVVDDSAFMRTEIKKILELDPDLEVIATAQNGQEALQLVKEHQPDVVTMDINMPKMNGLEALKRIMQEMPCPVVMVSALTSDSADETIEALAVGAFDFFQKPSGSISLDIALQADIIRKKVRIAARYKRRLRTKSKAWRKTEKKTKVIERIKQSLNRSRHERLATPSSIVAIGVSTGGPRALMSILPALPSDFKGSVIIAQHMPEKFTYSFANRLDGICALKVKEAENGEAIQNGVIYIAPGGRHLRVVKHSDAYHGIEVVNQPVNSLYIPSVEVLFRSLLENAGNQWLGVMLTGMGSDGAQALTDLRHIGGHTIAEAEESCVVFGMPRKVIELEGAEFTLHQDKIASKIVELIGNSVCH
ncbi:MAG: chemotaxis response regulator protein-glutamate methylesterase [Proteobacteria bacterium]|nr:chemotaxis response regulator protein-glutamate methylesterase [Pseudomonadota bacterium]